MINYNDYVNMERKDLESLFKHIENILITRNKIITDCFQKMDLNGLKEVLKTDREKIIPADAWSKLDFMGMKEKDLDFFLFIRELPDFKKYDNDAGSSMTDKVIYISFQNKNLFNFFIDNPDFSTQVKEMVSEFADSNITSKEVIEELFNRKLINASKFTLENVLKRKKENYIEYFLKHNTFEFSQEDYKRAYIISWNSSNKPLMDLVKQKFPAYKEITLSELINSINPYPHEDELSEKIRIFLNNDNRFLDTIKSHSITEIEVGNLISGFSKLTSNQEERYGKFVSLIVSDFPEHIETLKSKKDLIRFGSFKKVYEKSLNYIDLNMSLNNKEDIKNKKLKI